MRWLCGCAAARVLPGSTCTARTVTCHCPLLSNTEGEARLRQQQELYEAVRTERNNYSRSLVEVQVGALLLPRLVWQRHGAVLPGRSGGRAPAHACAAEEGHGAVGLAVDGRTALGGSTTVVVCKRKSQQS